MVPDRVGPAGVLGAPAAAGREGFASCEYRAAPPRRGAVRREEARTIAQRQLGCAIAVASSLVMTMALYGS